jgi:hypothetical protein
VFDGVQEMGLPRPKVIVVDIFKEAQLKAQWFASGGCLAKEDIAKRIGIRECPSYLN